MNDNEQFWVPSFDPYDALIQLKKNQEDLYNRLIITNRAVVELQQRLELGQAELNIAHRNNEVLEQLIHNLQYEIAFMKAMNQKDAVI